MTEKLKQILKDMNIDKETRSYFNDDNMQDFFHTFLENNVFITSKALTGDFLHKLGFNVYRGKNTISELRRMLTFSFKKYIHRAIKNKKIVRYNNNCYRIL